MSDRIRHDNTGPAQRPHAQEVVPGRSRAAGVQYLAPERAVNANLTRSAAAKHCRASAEAWFCLAAAAAGSLKPSVPGAKPG